MSEAPSQAPLTLGSLLYAKPSPIPQEHEWCRVLRSVAAGDTAALHRLYRMSHHIVFTLVMRLTARREVAEELTLDVYDALRREAAGYDASGGTVLAWLMMRARQTAIDWLCAQFRTDGSRPGIPSPAADGGGTADVLRPDPSLQLRLAQRLAGHGGADPELPPDTWHEPEWEQVADGIQCTLLAADSRRRRISMLVRLDAGASYPPHTHADDEELHLLDGELWIDGRRLLPGDYNFGEAGGGDERVWSATGCTCLLVTSTRDVLR